MCEAVERLVESRRPEWEKIGEKRGEKIGEKRGAQAEKKSTVLAMLDGNEPYEKIAKYTDLSIEEIKKIDAERK